MEEVWVAIMEINGEGALRPDNRLVFFYEEFWEIIRADVVATMEEF